ncbi:MAG: YpmA family protein [Firmicutes bacterium]|nr:YpmA family protein [Bacillota bacterium]
MELFADHEPLPLLGETVLDNPPDLVRLVTFLNRTLKSAGFVFGLRQLPDGRFRLAVYQTKARSGA